MKRFFSVLTVMALTAICLFACQAQKPASKQEQHRLKIVSTIFPQYDFAREIGKDKVSVSMLLKPGMESHHYEPTPHDIRMIQGSTLFIYTGGENDTWVEEILKSMGDKKPATLKLLDIIPATQKEAAPDTAHAHDTHHKKQIGIDEHVWTTPKNAMLIVNKIASVMKEKDPKNAETYEQNRQTYIHQLEQRDAEFRSIVATAKRRTILFGDRFPFRYFAEEYGLKYYAAFSGCSTEMEASAAAPAFLISKIKEEKIPVVFTLELSNEKIANVISDATGTKKRTFYSYHNITQAQMDAGETFLSMMKKNAESLKIALN